ncbi:WD40-repeat-containing domain protein [Blastocladiella britannica]|nr:WD40-repeat-containing domain protein [Blastocladiella britannica]
MTPWDTVAPQTLSLPRERRIALLAALLRDASDSDLLLAQAQAVATLLPEIPTASLNGDGFQHKRLPPLLMDLPDELLIHVLARIATPADLAATARTSVRMAAIVRDNHLWRDLVVRLGAEGFGAYPRPPPVTRRDSGLLAVVVASGPSETKTTKVPRSMVRSPWHSEFVKGYKTAMNWKRGACTVSRVVRRPGSLHADFDVGRSLVVSFTPSSSITWNLETGALHSQISSNPASAITTIRLTADHILTATSDAAIVVHDRATGVPLVRLRADRIPTAPQSEYGAVDADGTFCVAGAESGMVTAWDISTALASNSRHKGSPVPPATTAQVHELTPSACLVGHTTSITAVACARDSGLVAAGALDGSIRVWRVETKVSKHGNGDEQQHQQQQLVPIATALGAHPGGVFAMCIQGTHLITGGGDNSLKLWHLPQHHQSSKGAMIAADQLRLQRTFTGHTAPVICVAADSHKIVSGGADRSIKVWAMHATGSAAGTALYSLRDRHEAGLHAVRFDSGKLIASDFTSAVVVYDFEEPSETV